jgi:hypothetical protein
MADEPTNFSAELLWSGLAIRLRERILDNVWCRHCRDAVRIANYTVLSKPGGIILDGTCVACGNRVRRFVENPEAPPCQG